MKPLVRVLSIAFLVCGLAWPLHAQLVPPVQLQFFNAAGTSPLANGFLCTTQSGGSISQVTYQDQALTIANANPITLNAAGRPSSGGNEVAVFLQQLNYRLTAYASGTGNTCNGTTVGALIRQVDGVNGVLVTGSAQVAHLGLGAAADATANLLISQASNTNAVILTNSSVSKSWILYNITNGAATDLRFNESNTPADRLTLQAGGNVGVATTNPTETLHVNGTGRFTRAGFGTASDGSIQLTTTTGAAVLPLSSGSTVETSLGYRLATNSNAGVLDIGSDGTAGTWLQARNSGNFATDYPILLNPNGGNVAIGTTSVAAGLALDINGTFRASGAGPYAIGGATVSTAQWTETGSFVSSGAAIGIYQASTFSPAANTAGYGFYINPTLQKASSGTHALLTGGQIALTFGAGAAAVTDAVGWDIQSFTSPATTTNGTGLRVASPTSATNNFAARFFENDGSTLIMAWNNAGDVQWGKPLVALGGGAAPTLGTIGGAGPTTAAQNSWLRVLDNNGNAFWLPAWK